MSNSIAGAPLFPNCEVEYKYQHWLNSTSYTMIYKKGIVVRHVRERGGLQRPTGYVMVKLNGNKGLSKIHESKLKNLSTKKP